MNTHKKEAEFHDNLAKTENLKNINAVGAFEAPTAIENQFILQLMGDLAGKRLLDVGSGFGESAVYFALKGANVLCTDISPKMIEVTQTLAQKYNVNVQTLVTPAECITIEDNSFDLIYAGNLLHHIQDKAKLFHELNRLLKPSGKIFFWDPIKYNPLINIYRIIATKVRTEDERPLGIYDLALIRTHFTNIQTRFFWLLSLLLFVKYFLYDWLSPNSNRYWKLILHETEATLKWWHPLKRIDDFLLQIPGIKWLAWNMVVWGQKK